VGAGHVRLGPSLVDEQQADRIDAALMATPPFALGRDVGPMLLGGVQAFLKVSPSRARKRHTAP